MRDQAGRSRRTVSRPGRRCRARRRPAPWAGSRDRFMTAGCAPRRPGRRPVPRPAGQRSRWTALWPRSRLLPQLGEDVGAADELETDPARACSAGLGVPAPASAIEPYLRAGVRLRNRRARCRRTYSVGSPEDGSILAGEYSGTAHDSGRDRGGGSHESRRPATPHRPRVGIAAGLLLERSRRPLFKDGPIAYYAYDRGCLTRPEAITRELSPC